MLNAISSLFVRWSPAFANHHKDLLLESKEVQLVVVIAK